MELLIAIIFFVGLGVFIVWDRRQLARNAKPPPVLSEAQQSDVSQRRASNISFAVSFLCVVWAVNEWINPTSRPYTGKGSLAYEFFFQILGSHGPAVIWLVFAVFSLLMGVSLRPTPK